MNCSETIFYYGLKQCKTATNLSNQYYFIVKLLLHSANLQVDEFELRLTRMKALLKLIDIAYNSPQRICLQIYLQRLYEHLISNDDPRKNTFSLHFSHPSTNSSRNKMLEISIPHFHKKDSHQCIHIVLRKIHYNWSEILLLFIFVILKP